MADVRDFIEDGHKAHIRWDRDQIHITHVECPHQGVTSMCNRLRDYCVVNRFVGIYGAELNVGSISVTGPVELAWLPVQGEGDEDPEFRQVWVVPMEDPDYKAHKYAASHQDSLPDIDEDENE